MTQDSILVDIDDNVARITLNRPDAANGLTIPMARDLMRAAIRCDEDPNIRAIVVTGAGKMFCAGGDLKAFAEFGDQIASALKEMTVYLHAAISRLSRSSVPVIAAINGTAAGAGMSLAVSSDLAIASESAKFTMAYTAAGLSPDGSSTYFLPRMIGMRRTQELMLLNRKLTAEEALAWGVINRVVPDGEALSEATTLAHELAKGPTRAYGVVKKLLATSFHESLETQMEYEASGIAASSKTADGQEGIRAFVEKRAPKFSGE